MAWDVKDITEASELSPFATRRRVDPPMAQEDPLAASSVFASRGSASETFAPELEEEDEVVDKLPGHALEEVLRPIDHEEEAELEEPETTY